MRRLHVVGGLFSLLNSLSAASVQPHDEHCVLVLFTYDPDREEHLREIIARVVEPTSVRFLYDPAQYTALLSDGEWMHDFCAEPDEVRMFFTHNTWLHNQVFASYPSARIVLFEEGMASYYPGLIERYDARDRIAQVATHDYLGSFRPLDAATDPDLFGSLDRDRFVDLLAKLSGQQATSPFVGDGRDVLFLEQYFFRKGNAVTIEEQADLYAESVDLILSRGYRVWYKGHPREPSPLYDMVTERLDNSAVSDLQLLPQAPELFESLLLSTPPAAVVAVNSTGLLSGAHLFGVPGYRISTDFPLRVAERVPVERRGLTANHVGMAARLPSLDDLPSAAESDRLWPEFMSRLERWPPTHEDEGLLDLVASDFEQPFVDLVRAVADPSSSWVSFDVFDTLVSRPAMHPSDVFYLLDKPLANLLSPFTRFSNLRRVAIERLRARDRSTGREREEYTLAEIYAFMGELAGLRSDASDRLMAAELDLEARLLTARRSGVGLYCLAGAMGKRRALVSDTYFTAEQLHAMVVPHLGGVPDLILSSADEHATKRTGSLFEILTQRAGVEPGRILHVGDDGKSDVEQAAARGLATRLFPSAVSSSQRIAARRSAWSGFRQEKGSALVEGTVAGRLFDNPWRPFPVDSLCGGDPWTIGYSAVGPALLGWTLWVGRTARSRGYDRLLFLSRDGYVPLALYERLREFDPNLPESSYVFSSRRAALSMFSSDQGHIALTEFVHGMSPDNSVGNTIAARFGGETLHRLVPALRRAGFGRLDEPIGTARLADFKVLLAHLAPEIIDATSQRAELARQYYEGVVEGSARPAIVDVGYSGSSQRAISLGSGRRVAGLYFVAMEHNVEYAHILDMESEAWSSDRTFFHLGAVLEYLITPPGLPECTGFQRVGDRAVPVLETSSATDAVAASIAQGVQDFFDDVLRTFGADVMQLVSRADTSHRMLSLLLSRPTEPDARALEVSRHDDVIGANRGGLIEYWPAARQVLTTRAQQNVSVASSAGSIEGAPMADHSFVDRLRRLPAGRRALDRVDAAIRWRVAEETGRLSDRVQHQEVSLDALASQLETVSTELSQVHADLRDLRELIERVRYSGDSQ